MIKKFLVSFGLLVLCGSICLLKIHAETTSQPIGDKLKELDGCTVSVFSLDKGGMGRCSGTIIKKTNNKTYILSAKHCVAVRDETRVDNYLVSNIITSSTSDLALFIVNANITSKRAASISRGDAGFLLHVAYPKWKDVFRKSGRVLRYSAQWGFIDMEVIGGCSGGGLFNMSGELVGVVWGGFDMEKVGVFEHNKSVHRFINEINQILKEKI